MRASTSPRSRILATAALALGFAGSACSSQMTSAGQLDESLRAYHHHLLAGDLDRASAYVASQAMDSFLEIHGDEGKDRVVIEDFQVVSVRMQPQKDAKDPQRAVVMVSADVRRHDSITIRPTRYRQVWEQHGQRWVLAEESIAKKREPGTTGEDAPPRTAPEEEDGPK